MAHKEGRLRTIALGRLMLLSGRGQHGHAAAEEAIREFGAERTILRSAWFAQNFGEGFMAEMVADGV